jgi:hypothetical protein
MSAFLAPRGDVLFLFQRIQGCGIKSFFIKQQPKSRREMDLAALTARGKAGGTVGGGV